MLEKHHSNINSSLYGSEFNVGESTIKFKENVFRHTCTENKIMCGSLDEM